MVAICLAILMMVMLALPAAAEPTPAQVTVSKAEEMDGAYYSKLKDETGTALTGNPALTIVKYQYEGTAYGQTSKPIQGVQFQYAKVGGLYQLTLSDGTTATAYGVTNAFATAVGLSDPDYTFGNYQYYKNGETIQNATSQKTKEELQSFLAARQTGTTGTDGRIECTLDATNPWGLYLVVESDVSQAQMLDKDGEWQPISIVESQAPFLVALPTTMVTESNTQYWEEDVVANVKNAVDTAEVEKKIVVGADETMNDGNEAVADTDITTIGDTVHFRLKGTVLDITETSSKTIESYVLTDVISKGLTPVLNADSTVKIDAVRITGYDPNNEIVLDSNDYMVSGLLDYTEEQEQGSTLDADFTDGKYFTITFTPAGREKLTQLAKDPAPTGIGEEKAVWFYYSATVNSDAVIGPKGESAVSENSGNPNKVKLAYHVTGYQEDLVTEWDKVTEFTFGIDVDKQFEGTPPTDVSAVTFKLYSSTDNGATKHYYSFVKATTGVYHTPSSAVDENAATQLKLGTDNKISLKGLDEGTYYLEETATVPGYNLLKEPVKVEITADKGGNAYVADIYNSATSEYQGTFTQNDQKVGKVEFTVINTQGFQLPSTGGAGIWMFVIGGVIIIAAGGAYFLLTRKKKQ